MTLLLQLPDLALMRERVYQTIIFLSAYRSFRLPLSILWSLRWLTCYQHQWLLSPTRIDSGLFVYYLLKIIRMLNCDRHLLGKQLNILPILAQLLIIQLPYLRPPRCILPLPLWEKVTNLDAAIARRAHRVLWRVCRTGWDLSGPWRSRDRCFRRFYHETSVMLLIIFHF